MTRSKWWLLLLALSCMATVSAKRIPDDIARNFTLSCKVNCEQGAKQHGASPEVCESRCSCLGQRVQSTMTHEVFREAERLIGKKKEPPAAYTKSMSEAVSFCKKK